MFSRPRGKKGRLFLKFAVFTIALVAVSLIGLAALLLTNQRDAFREELRERWRQLSRTVGDNLETALAIGDEAHFILAAKRFGAHPDVESFVIVDRDRRTRFDSRDPDLTLAGRLDDPVVERCLETGRTILVLGGEATDRPGRGVVAMPIRRGDAIWGAGWVEFATRRFDQATARLFDRLWLLALLFTVAGILAALLLARHVSGPVVRLAGLAERVSEGDLDVTCELKRNDELGDLARSFDNMVANLRAARDGARVYIDNILESMVESLIVVDLGPAGPRIRTVNRATLKLLGRTEEELIGQAPSVVFGSPVRWDAIAAQLNKEGGNLCLDASYRLGSGEVRPVRLTASIMRQCDYLDSPEPCPYHPERGEYCSDRITGYVLVARDVTELRQSERIRRAANRISEAVHSAEDLPDLFQAVHRILGEIMPAENFYVALIDESTDTLSFPYFVDERDESPPDGMASSGLTRVLLRGKRLIRADAKSLLAMADSGARLLGTLPEEWIGTPLIVDGRTIGAMALQTYDPTRRFAAGAEEVLTFISEQVALAIDRKRADLERARLSSAVEQAADSIFVTDRRWRIVYVNPAFTKISGYERHEVIGRTPRILRGDAGYRNFFREMWTTITEGRAWTGRIGNRRKSGERFEVDAAISPVKDATGVTVNFVIVLHDISHEVQLEEQLRQSQKMEAIGKLAGGVAHDFNNLLSIINGCCELLLMETPPEHPTLARVEEISRAGQRATTLTRQLLAFSRRQVLMPRVIRLDVIVADVESMLRRIIGEDIELVTRCAPNLASARADPGQIEQVILNLAVNARDAMPHGGTLTLATTNVTLDEGDAEMHPGASPGDYVRLSVTDTGTGIPAEVKDRVFEPFFTTKEQGKGTGLGLSTVYGIVTQSGGFLSLDSSPGEGSTFHVFLPGTPAESREGASEKPHTALLPGAGTVLLAEDESGVREVAREFLQMSGYAVLEAADGVAALEIAAAHEGRIDLLVTDVVMPGLGGRELAERIVAVFPDIRVVYMSGYTEHAAFREGTLLKSEAFLAKPFGMRSLLEVIEKVSQAEPVAAD